MPEEVFELKYVATTGKAVLAIDSLEKRVDTFDKRVDASIAKLKMLGSDTSGITALSKVIDDLISKLGSLDSALDKPDSRVKTFGGKSPGVASFIGGIDKLATKLNWLEGKIDKPQVKLNAFGSNTANIAGFASAVNNLGAILQGLEAKSNAAAAALTGVGQNTSGLTRTVTRATDLQAALTGDVTQANALAAALANIKPPAGLGAGAGVPGAPAAPGAGGVMGAMLGAMAVRGGVRLIRAGGRAVAEAGGTERDTNIALAEKAAEFRESLRETALLAGKPTVDDALMDQQLAFQQSTAMHPEEAKTFSNQFEGAVASGKLRKNITDQTAKELKQEAAVFALRTEMDPETAGKMAGLLGEYGHVGSAKEGMGKLGEMQHHLNMLGVGSMKQLGKPLLGLMGEMVDEDGGRVKDPVELSAIFAASTIRSPSAPVAATSIRQANRSLRKMALTGAAGITNDDDYMTALRKVAPLITGANGDQWLRGQGHNNDKENQSLIKQAELIPVVDAQMKDPRAAAARAGAMGANQEFLGSTAGQARIADQQRLAAEIQRGRKSENVQILRVQAEARLQARGEIDTTATGITDKLNSAVNLGGVTGRDERIDQEVMAEMARRGQALTAKGVPIWGKKLPSGGDLGTELQRNMATSGAGRGIGSVIAGRATEVDERRREVIQEGDKMLRAAEMQLEAARINAQNAQNGRGPNAPAGGMPNVVPGRP